MPDYRLEVYCEGGLKPLSCSRFSDEYKALAAARRTIARAKREGFRAVVRVFGPDGKEVRSDALGVGLEA